VEELGERRQEVNLKHRKGCVPAEKLMAEELDERRRGDREKFRVRKLEAPKTRSRMRQQQQQAAGCSFLPTTLRFTSLVNRAMKMKMARAMKKMANRAMKKSGLAA
jgi:hypothetical protein